MLRILKLGNIVYENFEPKTFVATEYDENGMPTKFEEKWIIPTDLDTLKSAFIDTVKWQASNKLKETDWTVVKCTELGLNIEEKYPQIYQLRNNIRNWSNEKEQEINSATTLEELLNIDIKIP